MTSLGFLNWSLSPKKSRWTNIDWWWSSCLWVVIYNKVNYWNKREPPSRQRLRSAVRRPVCANTLHVSMWTPGLWPRRHQADLNHTPGGAACLWCTGATSPVLKQTNCWLFGSLLLALSSSDAWIKADNLIMKDELHVFVVRWEHFVNVVTIALQFSSSEKPFCSRFAVFVFKK